MVLSREKRLTAGKAPPRLKQGTPPPSMPPKPSKKAVIESRKASTGSQVSKKAAVPASPVKRLILALKPQGIQPMDLRREEDISTASPSPDPFADEASLLDEEEEEEIEEEQEKELEL